ncbi:hypothetical protein ATCC90586_002143 [Pythium insidiosum]|nr:hypothetical protein ATCC90586_002143 [Pythium insidiosum]
MTTPGWWQRDRDDDLDLDDAAMYHAAETDPMLAGARSPAKPTAGSGSVRTMRLERPSPRCNDWFFALLFIVHVIVIAVFAGWKGVPAVVAHVKTHKNADNTVTTEKQEDFTMIFSLAVALMGISVVVSALWMRFLMAYAASMIRIALWFNVGLVVVFAVTSFSVSPIMAIIFLGLAALNVCYIFAVQNRIAFASANLKTACAAVTDHMTIFLVALFMVVKQFAWLLLWSLSAIGVYQLFKESDPSCKNQPNALSRNNDDDLMPQHFCGGSPAGVALFFMLVSVYWGQQVIMNVLTCTTSGVVATWWYQANSKGATFGAMYRSLTTSFGSICFGSLIVAVLQALRTLASMLKEKAREDDNAALACVACLAECVLNCLEGIMEYINQWAYVYVGIYGYDFRTSGKAVMDLFANRGWTAVINDDLTSSALTFGAIGVGVMGCVIGLLMVHFSPEKWFIALGSKSAAYGFLGTIGFIAGMGMAMILANVVITALHTVFVCFAEDPIALSRNHPHEYETLVHGWRQFQGDALVAAYGTAV